MTICTSAPFFINKRDNGAKELPITDLRMTRFNISLEAGVALVMYAIGHHLGGEIFIPKIPSYHIQDVATAIAPNLRRWKWASVRERSCTRR
mgnify:CR=1 FL=1